MCRGTCATFQIEIINKNNRNKIVIVNHTDQTVIICIFFFIFFILLLYTNVKMFNMISSLSNNQNKFSG